ncbi:uncharacterized protein TRAVEDRAFT_132063, partial [Trametes versicolor FP-101664 SS1]|uniref:uncharacterized protein n=1 Tax=Trametes versicolor (strain FP-101664) TaxID=717944 RepID=UPI00046248FF
GEAVAHDPDRVVAMRRRQLDNEVHGDGSPWPRRDVKWMEKSVWLVTRCLDASANIARLDVAVNESLHARPREVTADEPECVNTPRVTCNERVVAHAHNISMKGRRYKEETFVEDKIAFLREVSVATRERLSPLGVCLVHILKALEHLQVVDGKSGQGCDGGWRH